MATIRLILILCVFISGLKINVDAARILAMFPIPSVSHQYVFQVYIQELVNRGHELVIIAPHPPQAKPREKSRGSITEIDIGFSYKMFGEFVEAEKANFKRGVIGDPSPDKLTVLYKFLAKLYYEQLNSPDVKKLLESDQKFDLIVAEAFLEVHFVLSHIFKAPMILLSSFFGFPEVYDAVGASSRHPIYYPHLQRVKFRNLTLMEKIEAIYTEYKLMEMVAKVDEVQNEMLKKIVSNAPTVSQLKDNIDLVFLNTHSIMTNNRPVPPNVVYLGGLHLKPIKLLPEDLQQFLDSSVQGVVYVSLGSNVRTSNMDEDMLNAFLDSFDGLPYNVLWKFDGEELKKKPANLRVEKWFPQRDLLAHPNIKVFVTQGGLQSFDEALDAGVPLVGIPMMNDQGYTVSKFVELGIAVEIDALTMTAGDLHNAIKTVAGDKSYRENMEKLRNITYDQPQTPIERAMFWTEYVLRHGGARHLRAPTANVSWSQYLMFDVLSTVAIMSLLVVGVVLVICYLVVVKLFFKRSKVKVN